MAPVSSSAQSPRFAPWIVVLGGFLIPLIYIPTLSTRFDFIDDGNLVYPSPPMPLTDRVSLVWQKIVANYDHLGPFRPVLWAHWEIVAELCHGDAYCWRLARLGWCMLAGGMLLAIMRELRLAAWPSLLATALAMWNPYRNEIWTSLTLSEGVAMPYALAGLWCAARANRSERAWPWDVASLLGVLLALGCKNTFAAVVPAQLYLRLFANGASWRDGWRRHRGRAVLLALSLLLPVGHYIWFRLNWHPGQYPPTDATWAQFARMLSALGGAMSLNFLGIGLVLMTVMLVKARRHVFAGPVSQDQERRSNGAWAIAAVLLVVFGVAIYLPMPAISGRYTMPAVWGLDLVLAGLFGMLFAAPITRWRRFAVGTIVAALIGVGIANVGRQDKFAARTDLLWQTLEYVEREVSPNTTLSWISGSKLNTEEGIHFQWHLWARGQERVNVELLDERGAVKPRCELAPASRTATFAVTGSVTPPPGGVWNLDHSFGSAFWFGRRQYDCYLWRRVLSDSEIVAK